MFQRVSKNLPHSTCKEEVENYTQAFIVLKQFKPNVHLGNHHTVKGAYKDSASSSTIF